MASEPASPDDAELFFSDQIVSGFIYLFTQIRSPLITKHLNQNPDFCGLIASAL